MTAVRRNCGKMFLVIGVKVARDAEVQKEVSKGRAVSGGLQVDVGSGVGVQGLTRMERIAGGKGGERTNMGVVAGQIRGAMDEGGRKEKLLGDRAFAVEYREVRLRLKLEIGGSRGREDKRGSEKKAGNSKGGLVEDCGKPALDAINGPSRETSFAELQVQLQELRRQQGVMIAKQQQQGVMMAWQPQQQPYSQGQPRYPQAEKAQLQQQQLVQWQAQEQAQYSAEEWARWQATWDPADDPKYVSLLKIQNKLNFMHRIPIPSLSSYPDGLTCLERISWKVERMMELLRVQNIQAFDELLREIEMVEKKDWREAGEDKRRQLFDDHLDRLHLCASKFSSPSPRSFHALPTVTTGPLSLELRSCLPSLPLPHPILGQIPEPPTIRVGQPRISEYIEEDLNRRRKRKRLSIFEPTYPHPVPGTKSTLSGFQACNYKPHPPSPPLPPGVMQDWLLPQPMGEEAMDYGELFDSGNCELSEIQEPPQFTNPELLHGQGIDPSAVTLEPSPGLQLQTIQNTHQGLGTLDSALEYNNWEGPVGNPLFKIHRPVAPEWSDTLSAAASPLFENQEYSEHNLLIASRNDFINYNGAPGIEGFTLPESVQSVQHMPSHSQISDPMQYQGPHIYI